MKRLTVLAIIVCVVLLTTPAVVISAPAGPPKGLDVNVVNPSENPVPVQVVGDEITTPYQGKMAIVRDPWNDDPDITSLSPTPEANKILIIEFISGKCNVDKDAEAFVPSFKTTFQGEEFTHYLTFDLADLIMEHGIRSRNYIFNQKTTIFADTNAPIEPDFYTWGGEPSVWCNWIVSGYLKNP